MARKARAEVAGGLRPQPGSGPAICDSDGRTNTAFDLNDSRFDRKCEFDFSARLKEAYSGVEAHGQSAPPLNQANSPYRQSYTYDEYNDATLRTGRIWSQSESDGASYSNDNKNGNFGYDAAGNVTFTGYSGDGGTRTYDAAGRPVTFTSSQTWQVYPNRPSNHPDAPALETQDTFDGTGQVVKHINHTRTDQSTSDLDGSNPVYVESDITTTTYYVHSTVLGGKTIEELDQNGAKQTGYVYAGGAKIATQTVAGSSNAVQIEATNPVTGATITADARETENRGQASDLAILRSREFPAWPLPETSSQQFNPNQRKSLTYHPGSFRKICLEGSPNEIVTVCSCIPFTCVILLIITSRS